MVSGAALPSPSMAAWKNAGFGSPQTTKSRRLLGRIFLAALYSLQLGCAGQLVAPTEAGIPEWVTEVKKRVATIRGLKFVREVPVVVESQNVMEEHVRTELLKDYGDSKIEDLSLAYAKLGLFPRGLDFKKSLLDSYRARVLGFYASNGNRVELLGESGSGTLLDDARRFAETRRQETVLAHELTHALQDQHFSLMGKLGPSKNKDRTLALRAIMEGDATLTEVAYRFGGLVQWPLASVSRAAASDSDKSPSTSSYVPVAILDRLAFQYESGASLVNRVYKEHGWRGIDLLYGAPPLSTEQVLHPEKYLDVPDPPTRVDIKDLASLYPLGWRQIEDNTLGELMVRCLFKRYFSRGEAKAASAGWDGDRFVAFRRGNDVSFIWASVWDSSGDAKEFFQKYQAILARKYRSFQSSDPPFHIEMRDRVVVIVEGLERTQITKGIGRVWQSLTLTEESFSPPFAKRRSPQFIVRSTPNPPPRTPPRFAANPKP